MPEAPEVEAVARTLRPLIRGKKIRRLHVGHAVAIRPQSSRALKKNCAGSQIQGVERFGKYLTLHLDHGCIVMHFKFDGQVLWFDDPKDALARNIHVDVAFETDDGALGFVDQRHLGRVNWLACLEDSAGIRALGVDAFSPEFTARGLATLCHENARQLKTLLMDQTRIAGLGNIYATESLWHARLNPERHSNQLTSQEIRRLHKAVVSVLARALECCLNPPPTFRDPQWWFNDLENILRVYDREGIPCTRCGRAIRRIWQNGRSTYFCKNCQR